MSYIFFKFLNLLSRIYSRLLSSLLTIQFSVKGRDVFVHYSGSFSYRNIMLGNSVYVGPNAYFSASVSYIKIGNKVVIGPNVTIMGGDHNTSVIGKYIFDVSNKRVEDDQPVIIEDDVWIGCNVTILKGVVIGSGSVIAAGSVVTKSIPSNSVAAGVPAKVIKNRFSDADYLLHTKLLAGNE